MGVPAFLAQFIDSYLSNRKLCYNIRRAKHERGHHMSSTGFHSRPIPAEYIVENSVIVGYTDYRRPFSQPKLIYLIFKNFFFSFAMLKY